MSANVTRTNIIRLVAIETPQMGTLSQAAALPTKEAPHTVWQ